jgi:hypothetical protein
MDFFSKALEQKKFPRILLNGILISVLLITGYLPSLAASTPVTGTTTDQLIIIQGSGAPASSGDYISATVAGGGLNSSYDFYIEVPPGLPQLVVDLYDQDVGGGGTNDNTGNRDAIRTNLDTCVRYRLYTPTGGISRTRVYGSQNGCQQTIRDNTGDHAWVNLRTIPNPVSGHWRLNVDMSSAVTTGDDVNAFGIRAHDGTSGSGGTELNIYSDSFFTVGDNINLAERNYTGYPYVTSGCQARVNNFDWDAVGANNYGSFSLTSRTGNFVHTNASMSTNNVWQNTQMNTWTSDRSAADYGIWTSRASIVWYNLSGTNNNNFGVVWLANYASAGGAPGASPQANSFRFYFPTDAGMAPAKPYLTQSFETISGPDPLNPAQTSVLMVTVQMVNPTGSIGAISFSNTNNIMAYVPGGEVLYAGGATISSGSLVAQPGLGAGGAITWNPGNVPADSIATLSYLVEVTPASAPEKIIITGSPTSNGTRAIYRDETDNTTQTRTTFTFGPLCELRADAESPTAVTLSSFDTRAAVEQIEVLWETAQEIDTLEFNILRSETPDGNRQAINETPIQAQAPGGVIGAQYQFTDTTVQLGEVYYYWLEVINLDGIQLFGPVIGHAGQNFFLPFISRD